MGDVIIAARDSSLIINVGLLTGGQYYPELSNYSHLRLDFWVTIDVIGTVRSVRVTSWLYQKNKVLHAHIWRGQNFQGENIFLQG